MRGRVLGARLSLRVKPTKNDPTGERRIVKGFILDERDSSLSAARAIRDMLAGDPVAGDQERVPLFRDPHTGRELTYETSSRELKRLLRIAGFGSSLQGVTPCGLEELLPMPMLRVEEK